MGDPKAFFQYLQHKGVEEGATSFPGLLNFTLDTYLKMLSIKKGCIIYNFWVLGMTRPETEPRSPGLMVNTLPIYIYIYIYSDF